MKDVFQLVEDSSRGIASQPQPPEMIQRDYDIRQRGIKAWGNDAKFGINKAWRHVITKQECLFIHILFN
jgi:hypothetical protein